jgi:hypothetical protein
MQSLSEHAWLPAMFYLVTTGRGLLYDKQQTRIIDSGCVCRANIGIDYETTGATAVGAARS